jgi:uncharacterized protein
MTAEFVIPIADIDAGGRPFDFVVRAGWIRGALEGCDATTSGKDGRLAVRVSRSGQDLVVRGHLTAELEAPCSRCLEPTRFPIDQELSLLFVPSKELRKKEADGEVELTGADADTFPYDGETLVLDDVVRDELVLETPMIPLCSEDCAGIRPPGGGASESDRDPSPADKIDPRLAPLLNLRFRTNSKE